MKELISKKGVNIIKGVGEDLKEITRENFSEITKQYPSNLSTNILGATF